MNNDEIARNDTETSSAKTFSQILANDDQAGATNLSTRPTNTDVSSRTAQRAELPLKTLTGFEEISKPDSIEGGRGGDGMEGTEVESQRLNERIVELEARYRNVVREKELASALAGRSLVRNAAEQLIKLWRDDFDVLDEGQSVAVRCKDGRSVVEVVEERLGSREYSHFCLPTSLGGNLSRSTRLAPVAGQSNNPANLGEAIVRQWNDRSARRGMTSSAIGLARHR